MSDVSITVRTAGPYLIRGPVTLLDADGNELADGSGKPNLALCRCGASDNKPFCDGTHARIGFMSADVSVEPIG
jgi:CDGSH-type Zn-finger protein